MIAYRLLFDTFLSLFLISASFPSMKVNWLMTKVDLQPKPNRPDDHVSVPRWRWCSQKSPCCRPIRHCTARAECRCPAARHPARSRRSWRGWSSGWLNTGTDSPLLDSSPRGTDEAAWLRWRCSPACGRRGGSEVDISICREFSGICQSLQWQRGSDRNSFQM